MSLGLTYHTPPTTPGATPPNEYLTLQMLVIDREVGGGSRDPVGVCGEIVRVTA